MKKLKRIVTLLLITSLLIGNQRYTFAAESDTENIVAENTNEETIDEEKVYFDVDFKIESEWDGHYNGKITIKNVSDINIENWKISFVTKDEIENIWCAKIDSHNADTYVIKNMGWNQDIKVGEEVSFGYTAKYDESYDEPHFFYMSQACQEVEVDYSLEYNVSSEWSTGLNGEILIHNNSNEVIEDWRLVLECESNIEAFWTADISHKENNQYFVENRRYNANVEPGQTVSLGFYVNKASEQEKFVLKSMKLYCMDVYKEDTVDTDGDGLYDVVENVIGTDINQKDSDGDGLEDFYEVEVLGINPLASDSDENGVLDSDEDNDGDGLTNKEEYLYGCNPVNEDSDEDGLSDYDEIKVYITNPNEQDTDEDTVEDFVEIQLGLNPLLKDSDNNGISDAEEKVQQTYHIDFNDGFATAVDISMLTNIYLEDDMYIDCDDESEVLETYNINGTYYNFDSELVDTNTPASIVFSFDEISIGIQPEKLKVFEFDGEKFVPIDSILDTDTHNIVVNVDTLKNQYCLGYEDNSNVVCLQTKTLLKAKKKYDKKQLAADIKKDFDKEKGWKNKIRTYSVAEAVDIVLKYDSEIEASAKKYKIKKEMIQAILIRELMCIWIQDDVADTLVMNYYHNQQEIEYYMSLSWWKQVLYGSPNCIYPQREDSSTGIGQMYAKTSINATNYLKETNYDYSNWKQRKVVWYKLKDNNKYSAGMIAKVLKQKAKGKNMSKPSKKEFQNLAALYNASTVKKGLAYGKKIYKYNKYFVKYNAAN